MKYVQCRLRQRRLKNEEGGTTEFYVFQIAWIPQYGTNKEKVEKGKIVELEKGDWWEVMTVSKPKDGVKVKSRERDYTKFQKAQPLLRGNK